MEENFSTLTEAITYIFHETKTNVLSLDQICQGLSQPNLFLHYSTGPKPCSTVSRKRISSILSSSDIFSRAGPPRSCMWSLKHSNLMSLSEGALLTCISQILTENGPLTIEDIIEKGDLTEATPQMICEFLTLRSGKFSIQTDKTWWFANQPLPRRWKFDSLISALIKSFEILQHDASIEELNWLLCLSTLPQGKRISRRKISRELSRRPDLFQHISRAKYALNFSNSQISAEMGQLPSEPINIPDEVAKPPMYNTGEMTAFNNNIVHANITHNPIVQPQINQNLTTTFTIPIIQNPPQIPDLQQCPSEQIPDPDPFLEEFKEPELPFDMPKQLYNNDMENEFQAVVPKCETPPIPTINYFDPADFFSIGSSASLENSFS